MFLQTICMRFEANILIKLERATKRKYFKQENKNKMQISKNIYVGSSKVFTTLPVIFWDIFGCSQWYAVMKTA